MKKHWLEYSLEALGLALFMACAGGAGVLVVHAQIGSALHARVLMGTLMGLVAIAIIYSPIGKRSGAHLNPAVTLSYWILGKVRSEDVLGYIGSQFAGGALGVFASARIFGAAFASPPIRYAVTVPGEYGSAAAFAGETIASFLLMAVVLHCSNSRRWSSLTGIAAGLWLAVVITVEAPLSGASMNTARSFASAVSGQVWDSFWIYCTAPFLGTMSAAVCFRARERRVYCAKLAHPETGRCIFCCDYHDLIEEG